MMPTHFITIICTCIIIITTKNITKSWALSKKYSGSCAYEEIHYYNVFLIIIVYLPLANLKSLNSAGKYPVVPMATKPLPLPILTSEATDFPSIAAVILSSYNIFYIH